jgi:hypothetical protein
MNLWITDEVMTSDATAHTARPVAGGWELSWLPGRVVDRNQAVSGMVIAENLAAGVAPDQGRSPLLRMLAAELGLSPGEALGHFTGAATAEAGSDAIWVEVAAEDAADDGSVDER